jgi:hypothetical protein
LSASVQGSLQNAKDTFYATLSSRIAAINPARTMVIRSAVRPGIVVSENELPGAAVDGINPADAFCLRWTGLSVDTHSALPLITQICEVRYATDGTTGLAGMDRGRSLAEMDAELSAAVSLQPQSTPRLTVSEIAGGGASTETATGTNVFWGDAAFRPAVMRGERMERSAEIEVFCYGC